MKTNTLLLLTISFIFLGCSGVKFYSDKDLKKRTGLVHYDPKPYLFIQYDPSNKDSPVLTKIFFLPDFSKPTYTKVISGLGSNDVSLSFNDGILANLNSKTDSKTSEIFTSVTGLVFPTKNSNDTESKTRVRAILYEIIIDPKTGITTLKEVKIE